MSFTIVARGKEGSEEEIKVVSRIPGSKGGKGFQLHFPCLSVHVTSPTDKYETEHWVITWSNYHERGKADKSPTQGGPQRGLHAGNFKLKRWQMKPEMIHVTSNGRKMTYTRAKAPGGLPMLDYCEMAKRWNSHYEMGTGWDFGEKHPMERTEEVCADCSTIDSIEEALKARFGDFGEQILELFVTHELFGEFIEPWVERELAKAA